jgi:hypothetical protein
MCEIIKKQNKADIGIKRTRAVRVKGGEGVRKYLPLTTI